MSNPIRYDSLLVHHLAHELDERLSGRRLRRLRMAPDERRLTLEFDDVALVWELHPTSGRVRTGPPPADPVVVEPPRGTQVRSVHAPTDERVVVVELGGRGGEDAVARIVVELMTNQWNALALDRTGRIRSVLWTRTAGERALRSGATYVPPAGLPRAGRGGSAGDEEAARRAVLAAAAEGVAGGAAGRLALVAGVAWTSPMNARWILGGERPDERWAALAPPSPAKPSVLADGQPYPHPLDEGRPASSLLEALGAAPPGAAPPAPGVPPELLERLRGRIQRSTSRLERLREERTGAGPEAEALRTRADLLLAQPHEAPKGSRTATLSDFGGGTVEVRLEPAQDAVENAQRMYAEARRRDRAAERLPKLIARAEAERDELAALLRRAEAGDVEADEVARRAGGSGGRGGGGGPGSAALPYRRYRTSGGLEVRVGRGSAANDDLTFHHSSPEDVWLHARDVAGAHVILRWGRKDENPPARDLAEAAVLAALRSRARTSGTVAVDWTRRKYVRKPRKAGPGLVVPERVKTVFVEPVAALEERLRDE